MNLYFRFFVLPYQPPKFVLDTHFLPMVNQLWIRHNTECCRYWMLNKNFKVSYMRRNLYRETFTNFYSADHVWKWFIVHLLKYRETSFPPIEIHHKRETFCRILFWVKIAVCKYSKREMLPIKFFKIQCRNNSQKSMFY